MQRDLRAYLWDIEHAIDEAHKFLGGRDFDGYKQDALVRAAVERKLTIIGEALRQLSERFPDEASHFEAFIGYIGFQTFLIFQYPEVENGIVWGAIKMLPELQERASSRLLELGAPDTL